MQDDKLKATGKTLPFLQKELELHQDLLKHKVVIKYFMENGKQETKDIIKNLLSY